MSRWLTKFLEKKSEIQPDKPDRFSPKTNVSVLSVMSGPSGELLEQNLRKLSEPQPDKPDRFNLKTNVSVLSGLSGPLHESFEERLAIAEYDGQQTHLQAQRIAYLDAFMAVLSALPYEEEDGYYDEDWLTRRVKATQRWLSLEGLQQPK
ncbi:MAG: hypothetical protein K2X02_08915 [Alphaproteobacteria bacterium]|nr:hypothetical protein [Alphaproteobacteria bacterium]